jgi:hypothetical protein
MLKFFNLQGVQVIGEDDIGLLNGEGNNVEPDKNGIIECMRKRKKEENFGRIVRTFANSSKTREAFFFFFSYCFQSKKAEKT